MKIANIDREILHIFWTSWGISVKFSGKMCLMIILKFTKNQGFTLTLEDTFLKKPQGEGQIVQSLNKKFGKHFQKSMILNKNLLAFL